MNESVQADRPASIDERRDSGSEGAPLTGEPISQRPGPDLDHLLAAIQSHAAEEIDAVDAYRKLALEASDPVIRSLMHVLVEDEEHHHRILHSIAMELYAIHSTGGGEMNLPPCAVDAATVESLRRLADREGHGVTDLRMLANEAPSLLSGLFSLLLSLMALDGEKHELILRHVVAELEWAARS